MLKISKGQCKLFDIIFDMNYIRLHYLKDWRINIMKKFLGISRNRLSQFQSARMTGLKRKNRFKSIGKEDEL